MPYGRANLPKSHWRVAIAILDNAVLKAHLSQCALGHQPSFEALYRATSAHLFAVALKVLRRKDWAEEILQESFIRIWHNAKNYDATLSAPMTWMTQITHNLAIDHLRRRREEPLPNTENDPMEYVEDMSAGPLEQLLAANDKATLSHCLDQLEAKQRQSIVIAYFQGFSHTELAQHLREPLGSVKSWVRRGLEQLRKCFES